MVRAWPLALVTATVACQQDGDTTCAVANDELSPVAVVVDNGEKIRAEIDFERGDRSAEPDPLKLCSDESLTIAGKKPTVTNHSDRVVYSVTLPADADRTVAFSLARSSGNDDIALSVPVPAAFEITAPPDGWKYQRGDALPVTWNPPRAGKTLRISLEEDIGYGICVVTDLPDNDYKAEGGVEVPDEGSWTMPAGSVDSKVPEPCRAFLVLERIAYADYPKGLAAGGYLEARAERTVQFQSIP